MRRHATAILLGMSLVASTGCIEDACSVDASERLLLVYSEHDPSSDTTNPHVFLSIQDALDAAPSPEGEGIETTICVADGVYREQLRVPAGVQILGRGVDRVRLRPPGGRDDETLIRVETQRSTRSAIRDVDIGGTSGACIEASGEGALDVFAVRLGSCGTAISARGGGSVRVGTSAIARNGLVLDASGVAQAWFTGCDLSGNDDLVRATDVGSSDPTPFGAGGVAFIGVTLSDNGGAVVISGGRFSATDVDVHGRGPATALIQATNATVSLARLDVRDGARPLVHATGGTVIVQNTARDGTSGGDAPVFELDADATLEAVHITLLGDGGPVLRAAAGTSATFENSIAWGHPTAVTGDGDVDVRSSLFQDPAAPTSGENLPPEDPQLDGFEPARSSPVRCVADPLVIPVHVVDLRGDPRPFTPGKTPDLGAVELQETCP
jgi:hypothetical protein